MELRHIKLAQKSCLDESTHKIKQLIAELRILCRKFIHIKS